MIVCICRGVSDRHIESLVASGAETAEQIEKLCGAGGDCGACRCEVERLVECAALCPPGRAAAASVPALVLVRARP
jgi:bacterioferritin-associated ferredoxin